jgi:molybdenum cofactor biosynthesis enzyme MoaA
MLVTTNATTLNIDKQAAKFLPYIDHLFLSVEAIDRELQQVISRTKVYVDWDKVFENINKYWKGSFLKANIVITKDNLDELFNMVKFTHEK